MVAPSKPTQDITFPELLNQFFDGKMSDYHTCLPAKIISYDRDKQKARVQPLLKRRYKDDTTANLPVINAVPVIFPRSKGAFLHFDLAADDIVTLVFSERSLDKWKYSDGDLIVPEDTRKGHLSDAYAIPGGYNFDGAFSPLANDGGLELVNNGHQFKIEKDGTILIKNSSGSLEVKPSGEIVATNNKVTITAKSTGDVTISNTSLSVDLKDSGKVSISNDTAELVSLLSDLISEIIGARTLTLLGLNPLVGLSQTFHVLKTKLDTFKV